MLSLKLIVINTFFLIVWGSVCNFAMATQKKSLQAVPSTKKKINSSSLKDRRRRIWSKRQKILREADRMLENSGVSYIYGGNRIGKPRQCEACTDCLRIKKPSSKNRLKKCPICRSCGVDCSHFINLVFNKAGLRTPYLATARMLALPSSVLRDRYQLINLGRRIKLARPGDLLVYRGHVVLLERFNSRTELENHTGRTSGVRGDIVHATGGRDVKAPGNGLQRARFVDLTAFKGPLLRILRHKSLYIAPKRVKNVASHPRKHGSSKHPTSSKLRRPKPQKTGSREDNQGGNLPSS